MGAAARFGATARFGGEIVRGEGFVETEGFAHSGVMGAAPLGAFSNVTW
jgi:hypothetical protein